MQKSILGLVQSAPCRIDIEFKDALGKPYKKMATVKTKGSETEELPLYSNKEDLIGEVTTSHMAMQPCISSTTHLQGNHACSHGPQIRVTPLTLKKLDHSGIRVQLLGQIELASERGTPHEFVSFGESS